jgi:hypothetical protein
MGNRLDPEKATAREWDLRAKLHEARVRIHDLEDALAAIIVCDVPGDVVVIAREALGPAKKEIR